MKSVVVVGAGPAGVSAALTLIKAGIKCTLLDRSTSPRHKTCGGALTQKSLNLIKEITEDELPDSVILSRVQTVTALNNGKTITTLNATEPFIMTDRIKLDHWLLQKFIESGGEFIENANVLKVDTVNNTVECSDGRRLCYDYLIGADGVRSCIRRHVTQHKTIEAFGVEAMIPVRSDRIIIELGSLKDGYLWSFPNGEYTQVGLAFTYDPKFDYVGHLKNYIRNAYNYKGDIKCKGAFLPYGKMQGKSINTQDKIWLVGDAGGFTDSLTGEGIHYGLLTGNIAGRSIIGKCDGEAEYKSIKNEIKRAYSLRTLIYGLRPISFMIVKRVEDPVKFVFENQIQHNLYNYKYLLMLKAMYKRHKQLSKT